MIHAYDANEEDERHDAEVVREMDEREEVIAAKRAASGISTELLSMQDAFIEGQRAGLLGLTAGLNPYQSGFPEHNEWDRGRLSVLGKALPARAA